MTAPARIEVFNKSFVRTGAIGAPKFLTVIPRFNRPSGATISLLASDKMVAKMTEKGARVTIADDSGEQIISGRVSKIRGSGPVKEQLVEFDILGDFTVLSEVLGWVVPAAAITDQGSAGSNWTSTGPMETVLKAAVQANAITRLGLPLVCATDLGRGPTITANLRFHPLYDRLFPVVDGSGIDGTGWGVTVKQQSGHLVLDVYQPAVYPHPLVPGSGIVQEWSYDLTPPTATDVVIGGQGEAQARAFRTVTDAALISDYGMRMERFRDARDTADPTTMYARGNETLAEGAPKSGLSLTLTTTPTFRYGKEIVVGSKVTVQIAPGVEIEDVMTEATLSWTREAGWMPVPKVGDRTDSDDAGLYRQLQLLARKLANKDRT